MSDKGKSTNAEVEQRVTKIYDLLIGGASRANILQFVSEKTE